MVLALLPALALYVLVAVLLGPSGPQDDEAVYLRIAERIGDGHYADASVSDADYVWYPPALPLLLAPLVALDLPLTIVRLLGPACLFGAVVLFAFFLRRFASPALALLGAYAFALYPPFLLVVRRTFSEPLAMLLIAAGLLLIARALESRSRRDTIGAGVAFGALVLTRVAFGWIVIGLLAVFVVWWLASGRAAGIGRVAAIFAIALAVTTPWLAYTYSLSERPLYWGNSGGLSLYWMTSAEPGELGDWHALDDAPPGHDAFLRSLDGLGPVERDVALQREAIETLKEHPGGYLGNLPPNVSRLLFGAPYTGESVGLSTLGYALPNLLLLVALAASLPTLVRRRATIPLVGWVTLAFGAMTFCFHSLLSAEPRMLFAIVPVAIWATVYALEARLSAPRRPPRPVDATPRPVT